MQVQVVGQEAAHFQEEVLASLRAFWGGRDVRHLHHPLWFRQFGGAALAVRDEVGCLTGYLLGAPTPFGGYVHVIAILPALRGRGLGRALYAQFASGLSASGPMTVEAITVPTNTPSIAFHRRLGFTATVVRDYAGPGEDRVHFAVKAETLCDG